MVTGDDSVAETTPGHPLEQVAEIIGRITAWFTLAMVLITFLVVILRYVFGWGSIALQESITYLHATVFLLGAAYALRHDTHVRVDIFYREMSDKGRARIDLIGSLVFLLPVCVYLVVVSYAYVAESWRMLESSREAGGLPLVFALKTLIPLSALLLIVQALARMPMLLRQARGD